MRRLFALMPAISVLITVGCAGLLDSLSAPPRTSPPTTNSPAQTSALEAHALANAPVVQLSWGELGFDPDGYVVERSAGNQTPVELARVDARTTAYTDSSAAADAMYTYRVRGARDARLTASASARAANFRIFDCTYFTNRPNLRPLGIETFREINVFYLLDKPGGGYDRTRPNEASVRDATRRAVANNQVLMVDIETFPEDIRIAPRADVQKTIDMYLKIIAWIRDERPEAKVGFYGSFPQRDYWTPVSYWQAVERQNEKWFKDNLPAYTEKYHQWQAANDFLKPVAEKVDYILPSLYTFYDDPTRWTYYAKGLISESKRYGKPVVPFIWMNFHDSTELINKDLSASFWRVQLETCRKLADGVAIWGGVHAEKGKRSTPQPWDESAPWWVTTKEFLSQQVIASK